LLTIYEQVSCSLFTLFRNNKEGGRLMIVFAFMRRLGIANRGCAIGTHRYNVANVQRLKVAIALTFSGNISSGRQ
jgi:hypothetical protein